MKKWIISYNKFCTDACEYREFSITIDAISEWDAMAKAEAMELQDPEVLGHVVMVIPTKDDGSPDWDNATDYDTINNN